MKIVPLTPDRWSDLEDLFGPSGACMGCWCMHWRAPNKEFHAGLGASMKAAFKKRVKAGPPPGLLAYEGDQAIGWLQIAPRADTPQFNSPRRVSAPLEPADAENESVWGATCFFVRRGHRGKGVTSALLESGLAYAKKNGARIVEACPIDGEPKKYVASMFVGNVSIFKRAGFKEVARRKDSRPLMRLVLTAQHKTKRST